MVFFSSSLSKSDAASIGDGGGSGIPGAYILTPGPGFKASIASARNNSAYELGVGLYTVRPSILNSNLLAGSTFSGATLANRTNISFVGIPGQTIIDGSSAPGELLFITNCSRIKFTGITFRGYTNHNFAAMPPFGGNLNGYLWAGVNVFKCSEILFEDCTFERHFDHGLQDKGAEVNTQVASFPISTNRMIVRDCKFEDIGSVRTNNGAGGVTAGLAHSSDGTAIVCTGWTVENCTFDRVLRGIEPYDESDGNGTVFQNFIARNNTFYNCVEFAIGCAGSTNAHNAQMERNTVINDTAFNWHGTNYGAAGIPMPCIAFNINGGRGWLINGNQARGAMYAGFYFINTSSFLDDFMVTDNLVTDINRGDGISYGYLIGSSTDNAAGASSVRRMYFARNRANNTPYSGFRIYAARDSIFTGNIGTRGALYAAVDTANAGMAFGVAGYTVNRLTNITVTGNTMLDLGQGAPFGFVLHSSIESMTFQDNAAVGFAANGGFTNLAGSAVAVYGPTRTVSALLDFGVIAANSSQTLTISAPGVSTNDVCEVIVNNLFDAGATSQVIPVAWCSNAVVYVRLANNDASGTVDFGNTRVVANVRAARIKGQ